jgi:hypothetical protein
VELNELVDQYAMGIRVVQVIMQDATPPGPVRPAWDSVNGAQQQRERMINEAWAEYNRDVPRAEGEAQEALLRAEGYALDRVNRARGEVDAVQRPPRGVPPGPRRDPDSPHAGGPGAVLGAGEAGRSSWIRRCEGHPAPLPARWIGSGCAFPPVPRPGLHGPPRRRFPMKTIAIFMAALPDSSLTQLHLHRERVGPGHRHGVRPPGGEARTEAGLHWRKPFIQRVHRLERRYLEWDGRAHPHRHPRQALPPGGRLRPLADRRPPPLLPAGAGRAHGPDPHR